MADKNTWLIAYDITAPHRLRRVHKFLAERAHPLQYSLFVADLTPTQRDRLLAALAKLIDPAQDDIRLYPVSEGANLTQYGRGSLPEGVHLFGAGAADLAGHADTAPTPKQNDKGQGNKEKKEEE